MPTGLTPGVDGAIPVPGQGPTKERTLFHHALRTVLPLSVLLLGTSACGEKTGQTAAMADQAAPAQQTAAPAASMAAAQNIWNGDILETMDAGGYTYVHLDTGVEKVWAAAPQTKVTVGQAVSVPKGMLMTDFESKTLGRTWPEIWFVSGIYPEGQVPIPGSAGTAAGTPAGGQGSLPSSMPGMGEAHNIVPDADVEAVAVAAGGHDIAGIYAQSAALRGTQVKVRGRVVKFTSNVMGTNWIHIQDGSGQGATADLTVTGKAEVSVGDVILVEGSLSVNKDFGAGYKYAAIIENATVTVE